MDFSATTWSYISICWIYFVMYNYIYTYVRVCVSLLTILGYHVMLWLCVKCVVLSCYMVVPKLVLWVYNGYVDVEKIEWIGWLNDVKGHSYVSQW